jgi:glycosyltransferase involved in cell wall biosynthesis
MATNLIKLKIALCIGSLEVGGAEKQLCRLAIELSELGHEVSVLVLNKQGPLCAYLDKYGIPYFGLLPEKDFSRSRTVNRIFRWVYFLKTLVRLLRTLNPDVVHAWLFHAYSTILPISQLLKVPVRISGRRGLTSGLRSTWLTSLGTYISNFSATALTANAQGVVDDIISNERVKKKKIKCITNGVDIPLLFANSGLNPPTGVVVANLIHYKGHIDLLRCLPLLEGSFHIVFIGEGPMREEIEHEIENLGLANLVTLHGYSNDPISHLLESQFSILPSHTEGMPNAILESMACGLPVVASDVGGISELLSDEGGIIVDVNDKNAWVKGLQIMIDDHAFRKSAGIHNRKIAENFSWRQVSNSYSQYYQAEYKRAVNVRHLPIEN